MIKNFKDIKYLLKGNEKQREAYRVLNHINIFNILNKYDPVLVGTIPIEIDIDNSDLDIICKVYDFEEFEKLLLYYFSNYDDFKIKRNHENEKEYIQCNFIVDAFEIEIYAEKLPIEKNNSYIHMIIENRLLNLTSEKFRKEIIRLKKTGLKTEPAFAKLLNIAGNPYDVLLKLKDMDDDELRNLSRSYL